MNKMKLEFLSRSENEAFARASSAAFAALLDPTVEELTEIKTAVSEAVSNAVIHAYAGLESGVITLEMTVHDDRRLIISVEDSGCGILDIPQAREPLYTTKQDEERSGMGFTVMESFTDRMEVVSAPGKGTRVTMLKQLDGVNEF